MTVSGGEIAYLDSTSKLTVEGGEITSLVVKEPDYAGLGSEATITDGTISELTYNGGHVAKADTVVLAAPEGYEWVQDGEVYVLTAKQIVDRDVTRIENSAECNFSADGKTLNVKNDQACVVIVKNGESYTKLTATENADGGYDFDLTNVAASAEIIIAVKGDTTGDGIANATDARQIIVAANGGTALSDVGYLCADTTGDGTPNATDARQIIVAANGGTAINW